MTGFPTSTGGTGGDALLPHRAGGSRLLPTVTIAIDYSYDADGFFQSQARHNLMQFAANAVGNILQRFARQRSCPAGNNFWTANFPDPSTWATRSINNLRRPGEHDHHLRGRVGTIPTSREAGTRQHRGIFRQRELGVVGSRPGPRAGWGASATPATDYGPWGGSISLQRFRLDELVFRPDPHGHQPSADRLPLGRRTRGRPRPRAGDVARVESTRLGGHFHGANAMLANGGQPVPVNPLGDHWAQGTQSDGGPALMDPALLNGTRAVLTSSGLRRPERRRLAGPGAAPVVQFARRLIVRVPGPARRASP